MREGHRAGSPSHRAAHLRESICFCSLEQYNEIHGGKADSLCATGEGRCAEESTVEYISLGISTLGYLADEMTTK